MCLYINEQATQELKDKCKREKKKKITVWKELKKNNVTPWQNVPVNSGWFIAKGDIDIRYSKLYGGVIHVYSKSEKPLNTNIHKDVKCYGWVDDLVAVGDNDDLAFTKIYIPEKELNGTPST